MKEYLFDERASIEQMMECGEVDDVNINKTIKKLARYNFYVQNMNQDDNYNAIVEYMNKNCSSFSEVGSYCDIKGCIRDANKSVWKNIKQVIITQSELDVIKSLNDIRYEKLAFVLLADAKYDNACKEKQLNLSYLSNSDLYKLARVTMPIKDRSIFLNFLYDKGLVEININPTTSNKKLLYIDDGEPGLILNENNYKELAFTYMNWKSGGYKECKHCGRLFKTKKSGNNITCKICEKKHPQKDVQLRKCVNCGDVLVIDNIYNTRTKMCKDCYHEHRKQNVKENVKKYRENKM